MSIGSTTAALREIDIDTFLRANTVVFDASLDQLSHESGDVMALIAHAPDWCEGVGLDRLITGNVLGRERSDDITVFKSVGSAAQDLLGASHVVREARQLGIGTEVDEIAFPKQF